MAVAADRALRVFLKADAGEFAPPGVKQLKRSKQRLPKTTQNFQGFGRL
jgi:hypothetical protein